MGEMVWMKNKSKQLKEKSKLSIANKPE